MAATQTKEDVDTLQEDIARLRADIEKLGKSFGDLAGSAKASAVQSGAEAFSGVEDQIKRQPVPSVLIALGLGVVVGHLLRR